MKKYFCVQRLIKSKRETLVSRTLKRVVDKYHQYQ